MRFLFGLASFVILAGAAVAWGQSGAYVPVAPAGNSASYVGGYPGAYHASTAAEGYANGMSNVVRAQGDYNLATSAAVVNMTQAQRTEIENHKIATQTYFDMRRINKEARDAERPKPPTQEQLIRMAQVGMPKRLTSSDLDPVSGQIRWPMLLTADDYTTQRPEVEKAFSDRAKQGGMKLDDFTKVQKVTKEMAAVLKTKIRDFPANQYMAAKRFLESLAYEAGLPQA
jgi:hypothetical protein